MLKLNIYIFLKLNCLITNFNRMLLFKLFMQIIVNANCINGTRDSVLKKLVHQANISENRREVSVGIFQPTIHGRMQWTTVTLKQSSVSTGLNFYR